MPNTHTGLLTALIAHPGGIITDLTAVALRRHGTWIVPDPIDNFFILFALHLTGFFTFGPSRAWPFDPSPKESPPLLHRGAPTPWGETLGIRYALMVKIL